MSEYLGDQGFRLLEQFEPGPDGKIATVAYRCPGGRYTLGLGATEWETGDPIQQGQECTVERAVELTGWSVRKFAAVVDGAVTQPISRNQRDALILMAYNVGPTAFADSSVVHFLNEGRPVKEVAAAFALWCKATSTGPEKGDLDDPYYRDIIGKNAKGEYIWVGPSAPPPPGYAVVRDGDMFWATIEGGPNIPLGLKPVNYQRAFPGLLRRHLSEACLFLDLDWVQACRKQTVSITSHREWDPKDKRWEDRVRSKTELADVLPVASRYKLKGEAAPVPAPEPIVIAEPAPAPSVEAVSPPPKPDVAVLSDTVETPAVDQAPMANVEAEPPTQAPVAPPTSTPIQKPAEASVRAGADAGGATLDPTAPQPPKSPPTLPPVVVAPPPRPPAPPVPIGQQTSAVNSADNSRDWSHGAKSMLLSRRFYGLVLVMCGRLWMMKTGSNALLSGVSDPIVTEMFSGFAVMIAGELIEWWGRAKATRPLK